MATPDPKNDVTIPQCACADDEARARLMQQVTSSRNQQTDDVGSYASIEQLYADMVQRRQQNGGDAVAAAAAFGPTIVRHAITGGLITREEAKRVIVQRSATQRLWGGAIQLVHERLAHACVAANERLAHACEHGQDIYVTDTCVYAVRAAASPRREGCDGIPLHAYLLQRADADHTELIARVGHLLAWIAKHPGPHKPKRTDVLLGRVLICDNDCIAVSMQLQDQVRRAYRDILKIAHQDV